MSKPARPRTRPGFTRIELWVASAVPSAPGN
jgi:hypothetical protein